MERFNEACNYVSEFAWRNKVFGKIELHKNLYYDIRPRFELSSQMVVRLIGKVSESYLTDRSCYHEFKPHGAIVYDQRILTIKALDTCSILTLEGRETITMSYGRYQPLELKRVRGQADLVLIKNQFYLLLIVDIPEDPQLEPQDIIGVDLGIVNIATTSTGETFSGKQCTESRKKYTRIKGILQSVCTWDAKKHLKKLSGKERRFKNDTNHCISKLIVTEAKDTGSGIALEDLTGIRDQVPGYKSLKTAIGKWAFYEIAMYIRYNAHMVGIPVYLVDPQYTSQQCSCCGYTSRENRKTQSDFFCIKCGYSDNADINAAKNIASRADVNQPIALRPEPKRSGRWKGKPTALAVGS
ncbi:IS605 OrfB family transposase [Methanocalculus alkaliphilus]|uniref:RNA-guided endonuclease InsQ/TnpB family protein n=1 Tax=Methanocalculus alkaliphilus TaxID=768730 RepID=UPI00209E74B7|nr:RNA-guided endonuclease TnpB family protein [Methanocalculus alkaliphilus]MCP1715682.1 IS605 OrfB family transposase [Methanocalculus alkaliphilus]